MLRHVKQSDAPRFVVQWWRHGKDTFDDRYGKELFVDSSTAASSSDRQRTGRSYLRSGSHPYGGSGSSSSGSWRDVTSEDDRSSIQITMGEISFQSFLEACSTGDMKKVKLAVEHDSNVMFWSVWEKLGWCWIPMRGEDYAARARYAGRPCMDVHSDLRRERVRNVMGSDVM